MLLNIQVLSQMADYSLLLFVRLILGVTDCFPFNNTVVILIILSCVCCITATLYTSVLSRMTLEYYISLFLVLSASLPKLQPPSILFYLFIFPLLIFFNFKKCVKMPSFQKLNICLLLLNLTVPTLEWPISAVPGPCIILTLFLLPYGFLK